MLPASQNDQVPTLNHDSTLSEPGIDIFISHSQSLECTILEHVAYRQRDKER